MKNDKKKKNKNTIILFICLIAIIICMLSEGILIYQEPHEKKVNTYPITFEKEDQKNPSFNPDGSKIVYSSTEDGEAYLDIWIMNSDGSDHRQITFEDKKEMNPIFSPDGNTIFFTSEIVVPISERYNQYFYSIQSVDLEGKNIKTILGTEFNATKPSVDEKYEKMAYLSNESGGWGIWIYYFKNGTRIPIINQLDFNERIEDVSISKDGEHLVFQTDMVSLWPHNCQVFTGDLWIIDSDGSNLKRLTNDSFDQRDSMFCSNDNNIFYSFASFTDEGEYTREICTMDLNGNNKKVIWKEQASDSEYNYQETKIVYVVGPWEEQDIWILELADEEESSFNTSFWINTLILSLVVIATVTIGIILLRKEKISEK